MIKKMSDYLSVVTADYTTTTLSVTPQDTMREHAADPNVQIHEGVDGSEQRVVIGSAATVFFVTLNWNVLSDSDAGTIIDFYYDAAKGNKTARTFKWAHPVDGSTYVVRFASSVPRDIGVASIYSLKGIVLKVLGKVA
jgi:hypothetical protein